MKSGCLAVRGCHTLTHAGYSKLDEKRTQTPARHIFIIYASFSARPTRHPMRHPKNRKQIEQFRILFGDCVHVCADRAWDMDACVVRWPLP